VYNHLCLRLHHLVGVTLADGDFFKNDGIKNKIKNTISMLALLKMEEFKFNFYFLELGASLGSSPNRRV
jgi:hypothetical protein